jgi:hypothetical protein
MTPSQELMLGATVPQAWVERFECLAQQTGRSVTDLVREALAQYIGMDNPRAIAPSSLATLEAELAALKAKVASFDSLNQQVAVLTVRLVALEKIAVQAPSQLSQAQALSVQAGELEDDDCYDEPDEVLTDFLL